MIITRVRIITPDKRISVRDKTWSQLCEMLKDLSQEDQRLFWDKKPVFLPDGTDVFLVEEGV